MKRFNRTSLATAVGLAILGLAPVTEAQTFTWTTVVNNGVTVPTCLPDTVETRLFNSYSQPSINEAGLVVFRGRSKGSDGGGGDNEIEVAAAPSGEQGQPARGIFSRYMGTKEAPISVVACVREEVPQPNNLYGVLDGAEVLGTFNEFPAFPRIDATSSTIATRGQSTPVWEYVTEYVVVDGDLTELTTKVGTSGVYVQYDGELLTGASLLGAAYDIEDDGTETLSFPEYSVPGDSVPAGTRFDQFPGGPTIAGKTFVAFKGNFSVPDAPGSETLIGKTGVFFRDIKRDDNMTFLVANSLTTRIPGSTTLFGSTAPPSAAGTYMFFVGSDNENAPTLGGIYRAKMSANAEKNLEPLVQIGTMVPAAGGATFAKFGEGLSVSKDANLVTFWGTWGTGPSDFVAKKLYCPVDGNKDIKAYCIQHAEGSDGAGYFYTVQVPVNQGIFVYNVKTKAINVIATTSEAYGFTDFLYWVYSGAPPGVGSGEGDREPPRWRSSAFAAVSLLDDKDYAVAFKGTTDVPGIFLSVNAGMPGKVVQVGDYGQQIDPLAPVGSLVTAIGIERDGFRGRNLAITASMLYSEIVEGELVSEGWAGIYLTTVKSPK